MSLAELPRTGKSPKPQQGVALPSWVTMARRRLMIHWCLSQIAQPEKRSMAELDVARLLQMTRHYFLAASNPTNHSRSNQFQMAQHQAVQSQLWCPRWLLNSHLMS
jgi:hypothetical protein